jgi:hypothetical protein
MMSSDQPRSLAYTLLTVIAVAAVCARIAGVELVFEPSMYRAAGDTSPEAPPRDWPAIRPNPMPTFSSNDRSRWCTVRALVDHGSFVIGHRDVDPNDPSKYVDRGIVFEDGWMTVDKVLDPETHDYYSSKPPLLTMLAAGEYWLVKHLLGWSITNDPNKVIKTIVFTVNAVPLLFYLLMLRQVVERLGTTDWGRMFVFASGCFGTFITTFAVTLNNHTLAAVATLAAIYPFLICEAPLPAGPWIVVAGLCAGFAASLELPALSLLAALTLAVLLRSPARAALFVLPAIAVYSCEFLLNKIALRDWLPAYSKFGGPWYEYPGSHWLKPPPGQVKHGIDWAREHESIYAYIFHFLVGHHGVFSLTPIWLLSFAAMIRRSLTRPMDRHWALFPLSLAVSIVVIVFYLCISNNYGGWTSGLRWLFWLTPVWLITMQPAADWLASRRWGRILGYLLLGVSVFSASFPAWNPWRHPWLYRLAESQGWLHY